MGRSGMDVVIKISDKCNFACEFCSSNMIATSHEELDLLKVIKFLEEHDNVRNIIINGGDPLCISPDWYYKLLNWLENNYNKDVNVSFTTNLWDFYKNPEKWEDLFKNHVSVCTSFQYGNERKLATGEVFTEEMFRKVYQVFLDKIGYPLKFIAVINDNNENTWKDTVLLAKDLGTKCRLNPALRSGRTTKPYSFVKMMNIWLNIIEEGLDEYEENCKLIRDAYDEKVTECPFNSFCHESIRCMSPDGTVHTCPAIADDIIKGVDKAYVSDSGVIKPFKDITLKSECYGCRNFHLCNSCTKRIIDIHDVGEEYLEEHCKGMRALSERIERLLK